MKRIVVAYEQNRVIGSQGELPWAGKMPADMQYFRRLTTGHTVIMGRKTFESIGRPLPDRQNIVVSRLSSLALDGITVARSLEEAYDFAEQETFVIGGGELYRAALPDAEVIHATEIETTIEGDATFPELDPQDWREVDRLEYPGDEKNAYDYAFVTFLRK